MNKEQKVLLQQVIEHRWFGLLETAVKEFEDSVLQSLKTISLWDEKQLQVLNAKQNYLKGIEDLMKFLKSKTTSIGKRNF